MLDLLFGPALLPFTIALLAAFGFGGLTLVGGLDGDADGDADADVDVDADGGGVLQALGVGMIPLSLLLLIVLLVFGVSGYVLHMLAGTVLAANGWTAAAQNALFVPLALVAAGASSRALGRRLRPLFSDYGRATRAGDLVGKIAVLKSSSVSPTFGSAVVPVDGDRIEIAVRTTDASPLAYGDRVVVYDFDAERGVYYVGPIEDAL